LSQFDNQAVQLRFSFATGDDLYNDFEGWYLKNVKVTGTESGSPVTVFSDPVTDGDTMFAASSDFGASPGWHVSDRRDSTFGGPAWWYGNEATGTYQSPNPTDNCTDSSANTGTITSAVFTLPSNSQLSFDTLWQIESVNPSSYDLMQVQVIPAYPPPGLTEQGVAGNESEYSTTCYAKDPVNCATGDFVHQVTDVSVPGRGVPLSLQRTYSSASAATDSPFGFGWTDSYNMALSLDTSGNATITQEDGSTVTFQPDGSGGFTAPPRVFATLVQNSDGSYTFTRQQTQVQYVFSPAGQLMSEVDANGYATTLAYDSSGRLASVTDPAGRSLTFGYSGSSSHVATVTDPMGRTFTYSYDSNGNLMQVSDPLDRTWKFTYDPSHLLLTMTDPRGGTTTNVYDTSDRVVSQTDAASLKTTWAYTGDPTSVAGGTTTMTDSHGNQTVYSYVDLELMSVTHGAGTSEAATTSYTYDPATLGQATITDPNGNVTTNTYDDSGNLLSSTDPLDNTTYYTYDSLDDLTSQQTPEGELTSYTYDGNGNLLTVTDPDDNVTTYAYADSSHPGDVTSITDPDGRVTSYTYDADGDRTSQTVHPATGQSDTTAWTYDTDGEAVCQASADATASGVTCPAAGGARIADTTTTSYNADGEATSFTDPDGHATSYGYDSDGNGTSVTDPDGNIVNTGYDPDNRPDSVTTGANGSDPSTTTTTYDRAPGTGTCLASVTEAIYCTATTDPAGNVTVDYYDARDELIEEARPGGQTIQYGYDLAGNQTSKTDAEGEVTSYGYDLDNQLTSVSYSDGSTPDVSYTYDADGRRSQMTDGTGTTYYSYDADSRLTQGTNGAGSTVSYSYDGRGDITSLIYPNGQTVTRTFDGAGRLSSVQDWLGNTTSFSYDPDGNLTSTTYPDGDTVSSSYDPADQLTATQVGPTGSGTPLAAIAYTRNSDGLVTQETDSGALTGTTSYSYDAKNELTAAGSAPYGYDTDGNPTSFGGTTQTFNTAGELTSATSGTGTASYGYNPDGELTTAALPSGATTSYTYDQAGNLTSAIIPGPQVSGISPSAGAAGTTVTISGSGFTGATAVKFGSASVTFTVASDSKITATAPAGTGTVDVTVTGPGGTSLTVSADRFTYTSTPAVTGISPPAGPVTGGTAVAITGTGLSGATAVHFGTKTAAFTVGSATSISATAPAGTGTVDVTVTTPAGTSATTSADRYTYTSAPVITKVSPGAGPKAGGTKVTVTGTGFTDASAVMFGSKQATTFTVASATSISATSPGGSGTVNITVTTPGGTSSQITADHFSYLPAPAVTKINPSSGPKAGGTKVTVTGTGFTDASAVKFGSKQATTFTVASATSISATSPGGSGTVNITVTTPGGTSSQITADHFSYLPAPAVTKISPGSGPAAGGTKVTITGTGFTDASAVKFGSKKATTFKVASATSISATSPSGSGTVDITVTTPGGTSSKVTADHFSYTGKAKPATVIRPAAGGPAATYTYSYNGDGLRMSKTTPTGTNYFTWDTSGATPLLLAGTNYFIYGPGNLPLEQINTSGTPAYFFHDAIGSTRALLTQAGTIGATFSYGPYGALTATTGTQTTPLAYTGAYRDSQTDLYYLTHRYYNPVTGQFLSVDPAVDLTHTPFSYANDDPINATDPTGLSITFEICLDRCIAYDTQQGWETGAGSPQASITDNHSDGSTLSLSTPWPATSAILSRNGTLTVTGSTKIGVGGQVIYQDGHISGSPCGSFLIFGACLPTQSSYGPSLPSVPKGFPPFLERANYRQFSPSAYVSYGDFSMCDDNSWL
jgi:RHS repeat-associated protein